MAPGRFDCAGALQSFIQAGRFPFPVFFAVPPPDPALRSAAAAAASLFRDASASIGTEAGNMALAAAVADPAAIA